MLTRARRPGWYGPRIATAVGACLLVLAAALGWRFTRGVEEFGNESILGSTTGTTATGPARVGESVPVTGGGVPNRPAAVAPQRLRIPTIGLDAGVEPVGLNRATNEVEVPESVAITGWYRYGPHLASTTGSIVVAGHVDGAAQGEGAFFRLRSVRPGVEVTLTGADGTAREFTVVSREVFAKNAAPLDRLFARDGPLRLTLITCGGAFDEDSRHYRDNVVVTAVPT